jgi:hypothetical protein
MGRSLAELALIAGTPTPHQITRRFGLWPKVFELDLIQ